MITVEKKAYELLRTYIKNADHKTFVSSLGKLRDKNKVCHCPLEREENVMLALQACIKCPLNLENSRENLAGSCAFWWTYLQLMGKIGALSKAEIHLKACELWVELELQKGRTWKVC